MSRNKVYNLRLTDFEWERLNAYAATKQITPAEVLRNYVNKLPSSGTLSPVVERGMSVYPDGQVDSLREESHCL